MNPARFAPYATAILLAAALLAPASARAGNVALSKPSTYTVGDAIAARAQGVFHTVAGLDAPTTVTYDRETHTIVVEIVGGTDDVEGAKREIEGYVDVVRGRLAGYAKRQYHVELADRDVTLIYYTTTDEDTPVEVLRRENGTYVIPKAAEDEGEGD